MICLFILNSSIISSVLITALLVVNLSLTIKNVKILAPFKFILVFSFILSIIVGAAMVAEKADLSRIILLVIAFLSFPIQLHSSKSIALVLIGLTTYLFVLQIGAALGIPYIELFISEFYPFEDNIWVYNSYENLGSLSSSRYAGIYYNPNIMGQSMVLLFLIAIRNVEVYFSNKMVIALISLFFISIILTGSRTATFTFLIICFFKYRRSFKTTLLIPLAGLILFLVLFNLENSASISDDLRSLDIETLYGTKNSSGTIKLDIFLNWFDRTANNSISSLVQLFFGIAVIQEQFDFDLGYIMQMFGFVGLTAFFLFFSKIFLITPRNNRYIFIIFLISIGATIIINFRFSILAIVIFSMYQENKIFTNKYD